MNYLTLLFLILMTVNVYAQKITIVDQSDTKHFLVDQPTPPPIKKDIEREVKKLVQMDQDLADLQAQRNALAQEIGDAQKILPVPVVVDTVTDTTPLDNNTVVLTP